MTPSFASQAARAIRLEREEHTARIRAKLSKLYGWLWVNRDRADHDPGDEDRSER